MRIFNKFTVKCFRFTWPCFVPKQMNFIIVLSTIWSLKSLEFDFKFGIVFFLSSLFGQPFCYFLLNVYANSILFFPWIHFLLLFYSIKLVFTPISSDIIWKIENNMGIPFKWMDDKSDSCKHQLKINKWIWKWNLKWFDTKHSLCSSPLFVTSDPNRKYIEHDPFKENRFIFVCFFLLFFLNETIEIYAVIVVTNSFISFLNGEIVFWFGSPVE